MVGDPEAVPVQLCVVWRDRMVDGVRGKLGDDAVESCGHREGKRPRTCTVLLPATFLRVAACAEDIAMVMMAALWLPVCLWVGVVGEDQRLDGLDDG